VIRPMGIARWLLTTMMPWRFDLGRDVPALKDRPRSVLAQATLASIDTTVTPMVGSLPLRTASLYAAPQGTTSARAAGATFLADVPLGKGTGHVDSRRTGADWIFTVSHGLQHAVCPDPFYSRGGEERSAAQRSGGDHSERTREREFFSRVGSPPASPAAHHRGRDGNPLRVPIYQYFLTAEAATRRKGQGLTIRRWCAGGC